MEVKGPLWHKLQFQTTRVVSDLISLKLWEQLGRAMVKVKGSEYGKSTGKTVRMLEEVMGRQGYI